MSEYYINIRDNGKDFILYDGKLRTFIACETMQLAESVCELLEVVLTKKETELSPVLLTLDEIKKMHDPRGIRVHVFSAPNLYAVPIDKSKRLEKR